MTSLEFWDALRIYCARLNGSVTSYGRTLTHNAKVGGVRWSAHTFWMAADVVYDDLTNLNGKEEVARRLGLRLIEEGDHDHLQPLDWLKG